MERRLRNLRSALCPTDVDVVERARDRCGYCALAPRAARWPVARSSASQICQRAASCEPEAAEAYDAVVVGGGAWGLSVLKLLRDANLRVVCVERGELCQNLRHYMHKMTMHFPTPVRRRRVLTWVLLPTVGRFWQPVLMSFCAIFVCFRST